MLRSRRPRRRGYGRHVRRRTKPLPVPRVLILAISLVLLTGAFAATAPRADAVRGLMIFPRIGGSHATFVLRFVAPFRTYAGPDDTGAFYYFEAEPPEGCALTSTDVQGSTVDLPLRPGDRASVLIELEELWLGNRARWCPGPYVGRLTYEKQFLDRDPVIHRLASNIVLQVSRKDVTTQGRRTRRIFFPRLGGLRETFIASVVAPYRSGQLRGGHTGWYAFRARGPRGCRHVKAPTLDGNYGIGFGSDAYRQRGDRVLLDIDPLTVAKSGRRSWCPGRYVGRVIYFKTDARDKVILRRRVASHIVFTVRRLVLPWR